MPRSEPFPNAPEPLRTPTYDGSGQCVHPDVLAVGGRFYGARYVMAVQPYAFGDDRLENPSLLTSDDGRAWVEAPGVPAPLVPAPAAGGWNSDGDLASDDGRLLLYYRYNSGRGETRLYLKESDDGTRWSEAEGLLTVDVSGEFVSPSVTVAGGRFRMFYVDSLRGQIRALESRDGRRWHAAASILDFPKVWHLDAVMHDGVPYLLVNNRHSLFLLRGAGSGRWSIYDANCERWLPFGPALKPIPLLAPSCGGWDSHFLYRGSLLMEDDGLLKIWYSARSPHNVWRVGYTDGRVRE
jgi:hypothetical protein